MLSGISYQEILIVLVVVLVGFGPKRLPELARGLARLMNSVRAASNDLRRTILVELDDANPTKPYRPTSGTGTYRDDYARPAADSYPTVEAGPQDDVIEAGGQPTAPIDDDTRHTD